jgi:antitoxin VapB
MKMEAIQIQNAKGGQAISLPEGFKINDDKVYIKKMGNVIYLIPFHSPWQNMVDSLGEFTPDFMDNRNQSPLQTRESFD